MIDRLKIRMNWRDRLRLFFFSEFLIVIIIQFFSTCVGPHSVCVRVCDLVDCFFYFSQHFSEVISKQIDYYCPTKDRLLRAREEICFIRILANNSDLIAKKKKNSQFYLSKTLNLFR